MKSYSISNPFLKPEVLCTESLSQSNQHRAFSYIHPMHREKSAVLRNKTFGVLKNREECQFHIVFTGYNKQT